MALKHVLLGFLTSQPSTGYSLHKTFFKPLRPQISLIYHTLSEMAAEGLIRIEKNLLTKHRGRKIFHITDAGYTELDNWMHNTKVPPMRDAFVPKILFAKLFDKERIIANLDAFRDKRKNEMKYYRDLKGWLTSDDPWENLYRYIGLEYLRQRGEAESKWAENAIERISSFQPTDVTVGGARKKTKSSQSKSKKAR